MNSNFKSLMTIIILKISFINYFIMIISFICIIIFVQNYKYFLYKSDIMVSLNLSMNFRNTMNIFYVYCDLNIY